MEGFTRDGVTVVCTGDRGCKEEGRVGALEENWKQDEVSVSSLNLGIERMGSNWAAHWSTFTTALFWWTQMGSPIERIRPNGQLGG